LAFHGALTDEGRSRLHAAVARCPIHKLMTATDVSIETVLPTESNAPTT
jgi:putative redox protein